MQIFFSSRKVLEKAKKLLLFGGPDQTAIQTCGPVILHKRWYDLCDFSICTFWPFPTLFLKKKNLHPFTHFVHNPEKLWILEPFLKTRERWLWFESLSVKCRTLCSEVVVSCRVYSSSCRERVVELEEELLGTQRSAGLPVRLPYDPQAGRELLSPPELLKRQPVRSKPALFGVSYISLLETSASSSILSGWGKIIWYWQGL